MKKIVLMIIPVLICGAAFIGCNKQEVVITVELPDQQEIDILFYSVPIYGTTYQGFRDTIKASETGKFVIKLKVSQPSFVTIWGKDNFNRTKLLVEHGKNYHVTIGANKDVKITGINEKGQMLYTKLPDPSFIEMGLGNWLRDTTMTLTSVQHQISELKQADLLKFKELLDSKEISKSYFEIVKRDRDCYYASLETRFLLIKTYEPISNETKIGADLLENLQKIYNQYPPNNENLLLSSFWPEYAKNYINDYQQFIQDDFEIQKFQDLIQSGMFNTYVINESKKYLSSKALEYFQATHIYFTCIQARSSFEKELISLFEQFEKDYPQSEYAKYLRPYIEKIIDYYNVIAKPEQTIQFIDNYEAVNTLEEAVKPLLGKKIYIDVWATWCSPCKEEFKHNEALKKILIESDIQSLYISIDRDDDDQKWKNDIKYYNLTGTHIRANKEFYGNLMRQYDKKAKDPYIEIPWYILIDEEGNIVEEHAKRPSQIVLGEKFW